MSFVYKRCPLTSRNSNMAENSKMEMKKDHPKTTPERATVHPRGLPTHPARHYYIYTSKKLTNMLLVKSI